MKFLFRILFLSILFIPFITSAQNINDALRLAYPGLGSGARALGMGNSYITLSEDASAAYFNPAGMGLLKKLEVSGGLNLSNYSNTATFFNSETDHSNSKTTLSSLSFVFPFPTFRGSLVFGLSYNNVKDFTGALKFDGYNQSSSVVEDLVFGSPDVPYELFLSDAGDNALITGQVQQSGDVLRSGSINNWTLTGAVEVYRNIYVGANFNIITGSYTSSNDYFEDDVFNNYSGLIDPSDPENSPSNFLSLEEKRLFDWDISGFDAKLGMIYQFAPQARFGMTIQFPKSYQIRENFTYSATSYFGSGDVFGYDYADEVEFDVSTPFTFSAGFSGNLQGLILSAEGNLTDYTQVEFSDGYGISEQYLADVNKDIKDLLRMVINYNIGLEYNVPTTPLRLRTGFFVQPSPYDGDPSEFDRKFVTAGLGFLVDNAFVIDFGYAYGWWEDYGDNYGVNVSRTNQDITYNKFILSTAFRF